VGSPFYTLDDVLLRREKTYTEEGNLHNIDDLNRDIAKAALR
jgi:hypothetical protein